MGANVGKTLHGLGCGLGGMLCGFGMVESGHLVRLNGLSKYATNGGLLGIGLTLVATATAAAIGYYFNYPTAPWLLSGYIVGSALGAGTLNLALDQNLDQPLPTLPMPGRPWRRPVARIREQFRETPFLTPGVLRRWAEEDSYDPDDEVVYVSEEEYQEQSPAESSFFPTRPPEGPSPPPGIEAI